MKISDIEMLHVVAHSRSLNEAAQKLYKTQPAITQAMKRLESQLGFKLFDRQNYRVVLTEHGQRFYKESTKLIGIRDDLQIMANEFSAGNEAKLTICYEPLCHQSAYNQVIASVFKQYTQTEIAITSGKRFVALEQVNSGDADLGIGPWFDLFHSTGDLDSIAVGEFKLGLVAKAGLLPCALPYEALANYPCLAMFESGFDFDSERLAYVRGTNVMKLDDIASIKSFLLSGLGFAMISLSHCQNELDAGLLERITITDRQDSFTAGIHVFRQHNKHHGPVARKVWSDFQELGKVYGR
ncbi:LysR family transcriptional regulator [Pseudoalteromonas sp. MMG012]|uniref:LysR family transcriptional regulator n=1 Tax=Pseudoalteromonas sp. MMG012 TaxID=2822686 RepID=UPI001B3A7B73|nr:LysR family transcriptional regulator [Pseudoalteromonas sp. MMG012]MBQ4849696.1 LysR family transcriptional regulator [Pseudoalteromonas sp. MMG012]